MACLSISGLVGKLAGNGMSLGMAWLGGLVVGCWRATAHLFWATVLPGFLVGLEFDRNTPKKDMPSPA